VDTGAALPLVFIGAGVLLGGLFLFYFYHSWQTQLNDENKRIQQLQAQKTDLEQIKLQVEAFEKQKVVLQQRVGNHRTVAAGPYRRAGASGPGGEHGFPG